MEVQSYRRRRPALSCNECRRRKIKCDRQSPCTQCTATKTICTYKSLTSTSVTEPQLQLGAPSTLISPVQNDGTSNSIQRNRVIVNELTASTDENAITRTVSDSLSVAGEHGPAQNKSFVGGDTNITHGSRHTESDLQRLLKRIESLENSRPVYQGHQASTNNHRALVLQSELRDAQLSQGKARVLRWNQWIGATREFATIISCFSDYSGSDNRATGQSAEIATLTTSIQELLARCKMTARMTKSLRPSRSSLCLDFRLIPPSREAADTMVNHYLHSFESVYRIVHLPTFWIEYEKYWEDPENASIPLRLKVLLIIAIGSSLESFDCLSAELRHASLRWVHGAQNWLSGPMEKDRLDISGIQIHCLTILARQVLSIGGDLIWVSMGSLVHEGMQIGLHRDPKNFPKMSVLQAEVRRRLWATILELVVQSSLDAGMPPRISLDEFDTLPPSNINDDEVVESSATLEPHETNVYTATSLQRLLLESLPTRMRVTQLLNGLNLELSYTDVLTLTSELVQSCQVSNEFVENHRDSGLLTFQGNLLDFMLRRFLLPLHFPFASEAHANSMFSYSRKLGLDTAMAIISPEPDKRYSNLQVVGGGMIKMGLRYAVTAICLELLSQVESQRLDGTLRRSSQYINFLKQAMKNAIALSLERIKSGETNVKSHTFASMVLAQVEAAQTGVPCELAIAHSAKSSLELCYGILCDQIEDASLLPATTTDFAGLYGGEETFGMELDFDFLSPDSMFV